MTCHIPDPTGCPKSKDGLHDFITIQGDDVAKDVKCEQCGKIDYETYY